MNRTRITVCLMLASYHAKVKLSTNLLNWHGCTLKTHASRYIIMWSYNYVKFCALFTHQWNSLVVSEIQTEIPALVHNIILLNLTWSDMISYIHQYTRLTSTCSYALPDFCLKGCHQGYRAQLNKVWRNTKSGAIFKFCIIYLELAFVYGTKRNYFYK